MAKDVKKMLKEVREAVNKQDMKTAIKIGRDIIKEDKNNYMAHLYIGRAYQDSNQTEAACFLRKAVTLTDDPLIPYQGLVKCVKASELPGVYYELLKLQPDKYQDYYEKLSDSGKKLSNPDVCLEVMEEILNSLTDSPEDEKKRNYLFNQLSELFLKQKQVDPKWNKLYALTLQRSIKRSHVDQHESYRRCVKLLADLKESKCLLETCCDMVDSFKNDSYPLEWICKIYIENMKTNAIPDIKDILKKDIKDYIESLYQLNPKSILGLITKGVHHFNEGKYFEALDILLSVNEIKPKWNTCLKLMVQIYTKFRAYSLAEKCYREMNSNEIEFIKCLVDNIDGSHEKFVEAESVCQKLMKEESNSKSELLFYLVKAKILKGDDDEIDKVFNELKATDEKLFTIAKALEFKTKNQYDEALSLLSSNIPTESDDFVLLGEIQYLANKSEECILSFLKALKCDISNSIAFYWLGKIYFNDNDQTRALKCLEKSLKLNPLNEDCFMLFEKCCKEINETELYQTMLNEAVKCGQELNIHWPIKMLGFYYLDQEQIEEAAIELRKALRINPHDYDCWVALGEIQMKNKTFANSQKIFEKICELFPDHSRSAKLKIATIKSKTNQFQEAEKDFEQIINDNPDFVEGLQMYAEAHLLESDFKRQKRLFGRSKSHLQSGVSLLGRSLKLSPDDLHLNLLFANALNFAGNLPQSLSYLEICSNILNPSTDEKEVITVQDEKLYILAAKWYEKALKLSEEKHVVYFQLAENQYQRFRRYYTESESGNDILEMAINFIKMAVNGNPNRWEYWNLYGLILASDEVGEPEIAEQMFNVGIEMNKDSYTLWANLGALYLKCNEIGAANKAFQKAQHNHIGYVNGWLGQALIAEHLNADDEAMDLFRHCLNLDYHELAMSGYSKWIIYRMDFMHEKKYKYAIEDMFAIPLCLDAIAWYVEEEDVHSSVESLCYLGYLSYNQGLYKTAADAYYKASEKAEGKELDDCLYNLGYILLILEQPEQAIKAFRNIKMTTLDAQIALAVAHFRAKNYEVSYSIYEAALESLAKTDNEKVQILTAMAAMLYEFQGEEDAKTVLMQCVQLTNPVAGLFSICALCLLHNDLQTAGLVINELKGYENQEIHCEQVTFLTSEFLFKMDKKKYGLNYIISMVHKFPNNAKLRTLLANAIVKHVPKNQKGLQVANCRIAKSVYCLKTGMKSIDSMEISNALALISLTNERINKDSQIIYAQKAVFINPSCKAARKALELCI